MMTTTVQHSALADELWGLVGRENIDSIADIYERLEIVASTEMQNLLNYWHPLAENENEVTDRTQMIHAVDYIIHLLSIKFLEQMVLSFFSLLHEGGLSHQFSNLCHFKHLLTVPHNLSTNTNFKELYDQAYQVERTITPDFLRKIYSISWSKVQALLGKNINLTLPELVLPGVLPTPHPTFKSPSWEVICDTLLRDNRETHIEAIAFPPFRIGEAQLAYMRDALQGKELNAIYLEVDQFDFTGNGMQILKEISLSHNVKKWDIRGVPAQFVASMKNFCHEHHIECQIVSS